MKKEEAYSDEEFGVKRDRESINSALTIEIGTITCIHMFMLCR